MGKAKQIYIAPISAKNARQVIRKLHYSGKVDPRSQLHLGVFLNGRCGGAIQFGPSVDKRRSINLVEGTGWNEFLELHRLAFTDWLPRNSESRAIGISLRILKEHYPQVKWVVTYADATQCGDGTIYRASGFILVGIKKNTQMCKMPDGEVCHKIVFEPSFSVRRSGIDRGVKQKYGKTGSETGGAFLKRIGAEPIPGFQIKYIYFLDKSYRQKLTVPELSYSKIDEMGAGMYLGKMRHPLMAASNQ